MKRFLLLTGLGLLLISNGRAQIVKWTFEGVSVSATSSTAPSVTSGSTLADAGSQTTGSAFSALHASNSTWSTPAGNGSLKSLSGTNWAVGDYFQFLFKTSNYSSISITWDATGSSTGPADFKVQYSTDGTSFTDATGTNSTYSLIVSNWSSGTPHSEHTRTLDLSGVSALENQSTVYIRLVVTTTNSIGGGTVASGGTSRVDNFIVNGTFTGASTNFYSKSSGNLTDVTTWGDQIDGTGTQPSNFISDGQIFNVVNRASVTLDANWTVSGASSKVIVGDGLSGTTLILPIGAALTGTIDVSNLSTLQLVNTTLPTFGTMQSGSTVEYAQTSTPFVIPTGTTYHHLKISSGGAGNVKTLASGTIYVNGNITVDGVADFNGSASPFSTISLAGNFTLQNSATFLSIASGGDANRMTLLCTGSTQTLSGGDFFFFRLQTPSSGTINVVLSSANLTLGNSSSNGAGGLDMRGSGHTLSLGSGNTLTLHGEGSFVNTNNATITGSTTANIIIDKTVYTNNIGSIGFTSGSQTLNNLSYNCTSGTNTTLTLTTPLSLSGNLTMTAGLIDIGANTFTVAGTASGLSTSYVKTSSLSGAFVLSNVTGIRNAPIGNSTYNPLIITNSSGYNWSLLVEDVLTVGNPLFASNSAKAVQREWHITPSTIPTATGTDMVFQWDDSDPTQIGVSYNNLEMVQIWREVNAGNPYGPDWIAVGVSQVAGNPPGPGIRTATISGWTLFSDFAISNISGPLPLKLLSFNAFKVNTGLSNLTWELATSCSDAAIFEVQKSTDGRSFSTFATIPGSLTNRFYNLNDNRLGKGVTYYRLKMIDVGNVVSYSKTVVIINGTDDIVITSLAPNPVHSSAVLTVSTAKSTRVDFKVFDMSGHVVRQWQSNIAEGNNIITINADGLAAGVYHILASSNEAKAFTRFIKQ